MREDVERRMRFTSCFPIWFAVLSLLVALILGACRQAGEKKPKTATKTSGHSAVQPAEKTPSVSKPIGKAIWVVNSSLMDSRLYKIDPAARKLIGNVAIDGAPRGIAAGEGAIWVCDYANDRVIKIDPASLKVVSSVNIGSTPTSIVTGGGSVWAISPNEGLLSVIDPASAKLNATLHVTNSLLTSLAYGAKGVWVPSVDFLVTRVDPRTVKTAASIKVTGNPSSVAVVGGKVWVLNPTFKELLEIDPANNATTKIELTQNMRFVAAGDTMLWLVGQGGTISGFDVASGKISLSYTVDGKITGLYSGKDALWVSIGPQNKVLAIDPKTGKSLAAIAIKGGPAALAYGP